MTKNKKAAIAVFVPVAVFWAIGVSVDQESREVRTRTVPKPGAEAISADIVQMIVDSIKLEPDVVDAAISQEDEDLALAIIVRSATSEGRAKQLGDSFVRMAKSLGPDDNPAKEIGPGRYDYRIGVKTLDGKTLAMGAKIDAAARITW